MTLSAKNDLQKLLPDQFIERIAEQIDYERIGILNRSGPFLGVEDEDRILRGLEEPAVARFGRFQSGLARGKKLTRIPGVSWSCHGSHPFGGTV